ncbi:MAG: DinB family protein, partial [Ferruginibacter sp.]|nr:DinB family protein [Ferruginibacter sp.]
FLKNEREKHIQFLYESADNFRNHVTEQGPMGPMDAYQIILLMSQHTVRHTKQIEEVKASAGYPAK